MEWLDILQRIESGESDQTEFKSSLNLNLIGPAVCAFANTEGGVIILGVSDERQIVGVGDNPEKVQERLTGFLQSGCSSPVSANIGRNQDPSGWVHWIEVPRQRGFEPLSHSGRVYVRRGRSSVTPSPSELQELLNVFGFNVTEELAIQSAGVSDIDTQGFRLYLESQDIETNEQPQPDTESDLRNRSVIADLGGTLHPTLYGIVAFGKEPQRYPQTSNFRVDCVAYNGENRASDVLQVADGRGTLDEQVRRSVGWFLGLGRFEYYSGLVREDRWLLPESAIREALVNAVVHRDYAITGSKVLLEVFSDRVDVSSPGSLPNHMSVESVRAGGAPRSRNELMVNYMVVRGLMEQRGRGWPIMRRAMREFNGTEPELEHDALFRSVKVTFRLDSP